MFRKLYILISAQHALMLAYRAEIALWAFAQTLPFIMMSVWTTAASHAGAAGAGGGFSMTAVEYSRYFLALFLVRNFSIVWMIYDFEWMVVEGRMTYLLLRPMNALWHFVSGHLGEQLARLPFTLAIVVLFFVVYPQALWMPTLFAVVGGIAATYCAFALRFALQYVLATLTFWFERASSLDQLSMLPYLFLSGFVIPLNDLPAGVREVLRWTPFPYMVDYPVRIVTGRLTPGSAELYQGFGIMAGWFLVLAALGAATWRRGLRRYSGQGA